MGNMKTTLDLPNDLVHEVKLRALHEGQELKDAVADLLRKGLASSPTPAAPQWSQWESRVASFRNVGDAWAAGKAAAPNEQAILNSDSFLKSLQRADFPPRQIGASVVGGIGFTFRNGSRKV